MNFMCDSLLPSSNFDIYSYYHEESLAQIHMSIKPHRKSESHNNNNRERFLSSGSSRNQPHHASALTVFNKQQDGGVKRGGSFVVGQKLRESKWFTHAEIGIFCAVVETGFIIEQKNGEHVRHGVAIWAPSYEKSKNPEYLTIYTITEEKGKYKVLACTISEFWPPETTVRINNSSDKSQTPLAEDDTRNQIISAQNSKRKWHNPEHFAYFCRYGPVEAQHLRMRKLTDHLRLNTGSFLVKIRRLTAK